MASTASRYGLTLAQLRDLLVRSEGRCELCRRETEKLVVDHEHATGRIRGILCHSCNVGMGLFGESPALLRSAAEYLERRNG